MEVKQERDGSDRAKDEQKRFNEAVNKAGGFGVVADCIEDLKGEKQDD